MHSFSSLFFFFSPLPFAILSDVWLGRYKTLCLSFSSVPLITRILTRANKLYSLNICGCTRPYLLNRTECGIDGLDNLFGYILFDQFYQLLIKLGPRSVFYSSICRKSRSALEFSTCRGQNPCAIAAYIVTSFSVKTPLTFKESNILGCKSTWKWRHWISFINMAYYSNLLTSHRKTYGVPL